MKTFFYPFLFLLFTSSQLFGQNQTGKTEIEDPQEIFVSAQSDFLYEDFAEALPAYSRLLKLYPDNDHIRYKIGICLLNDPFQKEKSIEYLEKAVKNTSKEFKDNTLKETRAPLDAWFYLGNAYRVNNQLDKALNAYQKFREILDPEVYDAELVDEQITACRNAQRLIKEPMDVDFRDVGEPVNSRYSELNPVVSGNEKSMIFVRQTAFQPQVFYSEKKDNDWSDPRNIMFEIGSDGDLFPTSISFDGKEAFFYGNDNMLGTLYSSRLVNGTWTKAKPLNDKINTKYWESHASISSDGLTLYFTSNRKGGQGGLDIYKATRTPGGDWGNPENLGPNLNTRYNEESPFISEDGEILYFSSYGHFNMGGYDVFYSSLLDDGKWSKPLNAGYPINTTDDDLFFVPLSNGTVAYMPRYDQKTSLGRMDIYRFDIYSSMHPRKFKLKGIVRLEGTATPANNPVMLRLFDRVKSDTLQEIRLTRDAGDYALDLPAGEYDLLITADGFIPRIEKLVIPGNGKNVDLSLVSRLLAEEKKMSQGKQPDQTPSSLKLIGNNDIIIHSGEPIKIQLELKRGSILDITSWVDSKPYRAEKLEAARERITYIYQPKPGLNVLEFKLTGLDKVIHRDTLLIRYDDGSSLLNQKADSLLNTIGTDDLQSLLKSMREKADGNLKALLDQLDLQKEQITSVGELVKYLLEHANQAGYTEQDVIDLLRKLSAEMNLADYLNLLISLSEGNLHNTLTAIDLGKDSIANAWELAQYLIKNSAKGDYSEKDVIHLLTRAASLDTPKPGDFLKKMIAFGDNSMDSFLKNFVKDANKIKDNNDLIDLLLSKTGGSGVVRDDITRLLVKMGSTWSLNDYRDKLLPWASGKLRKFLESIDFKKEGIFTPEQLIDYLLKNIEKGGYTIEDLLKMLLGYAGSVAEPLKEKPVPPVVTPGTGTGHNNNLLFYGLGGILGLGILLFLIILFIRKRRK
ncbi:MAG: tetratricopeptide repeat protein [Bacteroidales bacterium]